MALNIIDTNDKLNLDNGLNTFHKDIKKLPLISLMNNKNFKLTTKKKGKILNKPVYSGFNKNSLSSIPRDVEIILLNKNKEDITSNNQSILNNIETSNHNYYGKRGQRTMNDNNKMNRMYSLISNTLDDKRANLETTNNNNKNISIRKNNNNSEKKNKICATKDNWKMHYKKSLNDKKVSFNKNHSYLDLYYSQFYPGPTDYSSDKSYDLINQQNKYRYKSLFKSTSTQEKINKKNQLPGPGSYLKIRNLIDNNDKHLSINLATKEKRFKNLFSSASLSPWYYSSSNKDNTKEVNKSINSKGSLNKDLYDFKRYIIKEEIDDKGKVKQYYIEDLSLKKNNENNKGKNIIKNKIKQKTGNNRSINEYKFDNLLKKYIIVRNAEKEYEVPGPGQYNIYMGFDKIFKDKAIEKLQNPHKQENLIPEDVLKNYARNKNNMNFSFFSKDNDSNKNISKFSMNNSKSSEDIFSNREYRISSKGTLPFISKEKRITFQDIILSKHTPGPCYYYNNDPN